jgi:hypothetical protein
MRRIRRRENNDGKTQKESELGMSELKHIERLKW